MKFNDVVNLYLPFRCKVDNDEKIYTVSGISKDEGLWQFEWTDKFREHQSDWWNEGIGKPYLLKLDDMDDNDFEEICELIDDGKRDYRLPETKSELITDLKETRWLSIDIFHYLLKNGYDIFGFIENDEAIDAAILLN